MSADPPVPIYRAPMRARDVEVPGGLGAEYCLGQACVGMGVGPGERDAHLLHRFAMVPEGAFVWTRDRGGAYRLGRISGDLRAVRSAQAAGLGITHVRPARWLDRAFAEAEVPGAVARTFARGGRNFQRTHDGEAERLTARLWVSGQR
jgi:hypothetical protein